MKIITRLGLIDDEPLALVRLQSLISSIPGYEVSFSEVNPEEGMRLAVKSACDILITDMQMENLHGLLILEQMEQLGIPVIVCSGHSEFGVGSLNLSAVGYLIKPVDILVLKNVLEKAKEKMEFLSRKANKTEKDYFLVEDYGSFGYIKVYFQDLFYLSQEQNYTLFHVGSQVYKQRSTLHAVELGLSKNHFKRIHKSYIINLAKLERILPKEVILEDGIHLPLGKTFRDELIQVFKIFSHP